MRLAFLQGFDRWMARHPVAYASLILFAASVILILFVDLPFSIWLQQGGWAHLDPIFNAIGQMGRSEGWLTLSILTYIAINLARLHRPQGPRVPRYRWLTRHINLFFFSLLASTAIVHLLKNLIARGRPALWYGNGDYGFSWPFLRSFPYDAYPSGHTQVAFAVAAVLALMAPRWRHTFFLLAGLVALSRIVNGAHYLSDAVAGAFISVAMTLALRPIFLDPQRQWVSETPLDWIFLRRRRAQAKASPASTRA